MARTYKRKTAEDPERCDGLRDAMRAVNRKSHSINKAAKVYKVSKATLLRHLAHNKNTLSETVNEDTSLECLVVGHPHNLPQECEVELVQCLTIMAKWGFGLTPSEICDYVKDFVIERKNGKDEIGKHLRKYCRFVDNRPGEDWVY